MKKAYLISYDLNAPNKNYKKLYEAIKNIGTWWHYLDSTWIVSSDESIDSIGEKLNKEIDKDDSLLIVEIKDNCYGWLPEKAWDWIERNVPE